MSSAVVATRAELIELGRVFENPPRRGPRRRVGAPLAGPHASRFRGQGMEFSEVRAYQPGDDLRSIEWRVTARTGRVHSKLYEEERERPVWLVADLGASMRFATRGVFKSVAAARAAALFAWQAHRAGERVGGLFLSPAMAAELPPGRTRRHLLGVLGALADGTADAVAGAEPSLAAELRRLRAKVRTGSRVVVLSDFYGLDDELEGVLQALARRCDVSLVWVYDRLEAEAPPPGHYRVSDGREVARLLVRSRREWRRSYAARFFERGGRLRSLASRHRMELLRLRTDAPPEALLSGRHPELPLPEAS